MLILSLTTACVYLVAFMLLSLAGPIYELICKDCGIALDFAPECFVQASRWRIGDVCLVISGLCIIAPWIILEKDDLHVAAIFTSLLGLVVVFLASWGLTQGLYKVHVMLARADNYLYSNKHYRRPITTSNPTSKFNPQVQH